MIHTIDRYLGPQPAANGAFAHVYLLRCGAQVRMGQGGLEPGVGVNAGQGAGPCPVCRQQNMRFAAAMQQDAAKQNQNIAPGGIPKGSVGGFDTTTKSIDSDLGGLEDDGEVLNNEHDPYPETPL